MDTTAIDVFTKCVEAISNNILIQRESRKDKEFHFQNWFKDRIIETGLYFEREGRNSYPDFRLVEKTIGFEVKGLAYPGRVNNLDCNSQVPTGFHNGRTIYYVFGRYPSQPDGDKYPVLDLVVCHGDFINANHDYVHKNKHIKGFGSYGDIMIRDRKMYVAPTPFFLLDGVAHCNTLILPSEIELSAPFINVGNIVRYETDDVVVGYDFDLVKNSIKSSTIKNPDAGKEHRFSAWRLNQSKGVSVTLKEKIEIGEIITTLIE
ncbi:MAG: hypothetical protein GYA51_13945 [Candidatus Methanofastidiosa archaeon]|nr:hypothetical protein [Candidatus Methanofastidiosa archaeon]